MYIRFCMQNFVWCCVLYVGVEDFFNCGQVLVFVVDFFGWSENLRGFNIQSFCCKCLEFFIKDDGVRVVCFYEFYFLWGERVSYIDQFFRVVRGVEFFFFGVDFEDCIGFY